jgi:hypothetical protein
VVTTERDVLAEAMDRARRLGHGTTASAILAALHASGYAIVPEATVARLREALTCGLAAAVRAALTVESEAKPDPDALDANDESSPAVICDSGETLE